LAPLAPKMQTSKKGLGAPPSKNEMAKVKKEQRQVAGLPPESSESRYPPPPPPPPHLLHHNEQQQPHKAQSLDFPMVSLTSPPQLGPGVSLLSALQSAGVILDGKYGRVNVAPQYHPPVNAGMGIGRVDFNVPPPTQVPMNVGMGISADFGGSYFSSTPFQYFSNTPFPYQPTFNPHQNR
jgi:hypothetical protein